jgi:hypothetical protein
VRVSCAHKGVTMQRLRASLIALLLVCPAALAQSTVDGSLTANGKTFPLKYAVAHPQKNPFDKKKTDTVIVFTDQAISPLQASDDIELMTVIGDKKLSGFTIEIDPDKSVISGQVFSPAFKKMTQFSGVGMQKLDLTAVSPTRVTGKVWMAKPDDFFDNVYQYTATFDLPVATATAMAPPAPKGTPLPAGGGEPGKAYAAYLKVLTAGDIPALRKSLAASRAKDIDDPDFKKMFPMIQAMQPKNIKVTGGAVDGDSATLLATAKDGQETSTGTVNMVREGGAWKVEKESWKTRSE